jgi:Holliday junction resolvase RusA-like endonuclease
MIESNCRNDLDNLQSSILDMLEGIVYENDRQVREVIARKTKKERGENYKTTIVVEELENG